VSEARKIYDQWNVSDEGLPEHANIVLELDAENKRLTADLAAAHGNADDNYKKLMDTRDLRDAAKGECKRLASVLDLEKRQNRLLSAELAAEKGRYNAISRDFQNLVLTHDKLREALEPFAKEAEVTPEAKDVWMVDGSGYGRLTVGDLRRARAALAETGDDNE
jgi:chromosome segregation ATPase